MSNGRLQCKKKHLRYLIDSHRYLSEYLKLRKQLQEQTIAGLGGSNCNLESSKLSLLQISRVFCVSEVSKTSKTILGNLIQNIQNYSSTFKQIMSISTIPDFWRMRDIRYRIYF